MMQARQSAREQRTDTVVFLGPSLDLGAARQRLAADFRPPIRRGDLPRAAQQGARRVAIIDGEFGQALSVSILEVRAALRSGVEVWGASSMGALRAAECWPIGMLGVGWVYEQYRSGAIQADDEVALIFDASTGAARTTPLVNMRWSAQQATDAGVLCAADAAEILGFAATLRYEQRSYRCLQRLAPAQLQPAIAALLGWVSSHPERADRKGLDADELLRRLAGTPEAS
jgi:hypothetical protein